MGPELIAPDRLALWRRARRVLCLRIDNLGDVLMTTPALRALRLCAPERHITLLASRSGAALAQHLPDVDEVIAYDAPWAAHPNDAGIADDEALIARLHAGRYDAAVIFTVFSQSPLPAAMLLRLAGIPLVAAHCRENPYRLISDRIVEPETGMPTRHEVRRQLDLVAALGAGTGDERLGFHVQESDRASFAQRMSRAGIATDERWLLAHPGATAASRRYPPELFAQALQQLHARSGLRVVLGGAASDRAIVAEVHARLLEAGVAALDLSGELSLGELGACIDAAAVLIANNSGAVHIAAALNTPVVDLYALTNPQHTPWQVPHAVLAQDVACRWCYRSVCVSGHHSCLRGIAPAQVSDAALQLLAGRTPARCCDWLMPDSSTPASPLAATTPDTRHAGPAERCTQAQAA